MPAMVVTVARRAEELDRALGGTRRDAVGLGEGADRSLDLADHRGVGRAGDAVAAVSLGERHHPMADGGPCRERGRLAVIQTDPDELGAAAADIEQQHVPHRPVEQRRAAVEGQLDFLARRDDLHGEPGLVADAVDERLAILGAPAGLGRHRPVALDTAPSELAGADSERPDGSPDRLLREPAGLRHAFAETHDPGEGIDDAEARASRPRDEEPAVVRAEVERAE